MNEQDVTAETADVGVFASHQDYEEQRSAGHAFGVTVNAYRRIKFLPVLVAVNHDSSAPNHRLGPDSIHFIADVENAVKKALGGNAVLIRQFEQIVEGKRVQNKRSIVEKCGRIFRARKLQPNFYFKVIKQGRKRNPNGAPIREAAA